VEILCTLLLRAIKSSKLWGQIPGGEKRIRQVNYEEERGEYMQVLSLIAQSADVHASNVRIFLRILVLIAVILLVTGMTVALVTWRNMHKL
jgi:hypothetical protein